MADSLRVVSGGDSSVRLSATDAWLAAVPELTPLTGPEGTAERLLLLLHYGVDWDSWVGQRLPRYWDVLLPSACRKYTYRSGGKLGRWWQGASAHLEATPRNAVQRREVVQLLADPCPGEVLSAFRSESLMLTLRVRVVADRVRQAKQQQLLLTAKGAGEVGA